MEIPVYTRTQVDLYNKTFQSTYQRGIKITMNNNNEKTVYPHTEYHCTYFQSLAEKHTDFCNP